MNGISKFLAGVAATALLTTVAHSWLGTGADFTNRLESDALTAIGNAGGGGQVDLTVIRDPALQRVVLLTGTFDAETRDQLLAAVRAVPGVSAARWSDATGPSTVPGEARPNDVTMALLAESLGTLLLFFGIGVAIGGLLWRRQKR